MTNIHKKSARFEPFTLDEGILLGFFVQQSSQAISYGDMDEEGYFSINAKQLGAIQLNDEAQQKAFNLLVNRGYITEKIASRTGKTSYKLYVDTLLTEIPQA